eukprot:comp23705_c1_seq2/m.40752 comp23705_c1_seq2/g.40752  ORF comp23705_c1_seq2/g.40752 comp23705_c1_seq2/m.40752 type:complete len:651 (-) comp23705_c1_seq2:401-2353(-)
MAPVPGEPKPANLEQQQGEEGEDGRGQKKEGARRDRQNRKNRGDGKGRPWISNGYPNQPGRGGGRPNPMQMGQNPFLQWATPDPSFFPPAFIGGPGMPPFAPMPGSFAPGPGPFPPQPPNVIMMQPPMMPPPPQAPGMEEDQIARQMSLQGMGVSPQRNQPILMAPDGFEAKDSNADLAAQFNQLQLGGADPNHYYAYPMAPTKQGQQQPFVLPQQMPFPPLQMPFGAAPPFWPIPSKCKFFQHGNCKHGDRCKYSHVISNAPLLPSTWAVGPSSRPSQRPSPGYQPSNASADAPAISPLSQAVAKNLNLPLSEVKGRIAVLCKDQHGCRFLQRKLEDGRTDDVDAIFSEVVDHLGDLMRDPFGNYLCQKLAEVCNKDQRTLMVQKVCADLVQISVDPHGTRAIQKVIECMTEPHQVEAVVGALKGHAVMLIKDLNGNHVIQRCLQCLPSDQKQFICDDVAAHCVEVATHKHGCCVMQRCIDQASEQQRVRLVTEITYNAMQLVQDQYGNYVVQYVLKQRNQRFTNALIRQFLGHIPALAVQKFASNVMERSLDVADAETRASMVAELIDPQYLGSLLADQFGNYVIQTALDKADGPLQAKIIEAIRPMLPGIGHLPYGKKIHYKIQQKEDPARAMPPRQPHKRAPRPQN